MALSPIGQKAGPLCLIAAVLIVLSQVMRLVGGRLLGPDWATTPAYPLIYTLALLGMGTLLLALTAIYTREFAAPGQARPDRLPDRVPRHRDGRRRLVVRGVRDPEDRSRGARVS